MDNVKLTTANFSHKFRKTLITENCLEIDAGLKISGYEPFDIGFESPNGRVERIVSYKKGNNILTFYIGTTDFISFKVFDLTKGLSKTTTQFPSVAIKDIAAIVKLIES